MFTERVRDDKVLKLLEPLPWEDQLGAIVTWVIGLLPAMLKGEIREWREFILDVMFHKRVILTIQMVHENGKRLHEMMEKMLHTYSFRVQIDVPELTEELANKLFEAGCDDATPFQTLGNCYLDFDREAPDLESAMQSAKDDIGKLGIKVLWIDIPTGNAYLKKEQ